MNKFDIQGNPKSKFVLNFKKSSYYSVQKSVWSNSYEKLCDYARLLVMENYQTVYIDGNDESLLWLHDRMCQMKTKRSKYFKISRKSKEEDLN